MALTRHDLQRPTSADRLEALQDIDRLIAYCHPDGRSPSAGNAGLIPIFPENSSLDFRHIPSTLVRMTLPTPSKRSHERR